MSSPETTDWHNDAKRPSISPLSSDCDSELWRLATEGDPDALSHFDVRLAREVQNGGDARNDSDECSDEYDSPARPRPLTPTVPSLQYKVSTYS